MSEQQIYEVIDDFVDWCSNTSSFWCDDRVPEEHVVMDKLERCYNKQYIDIITKYNIINLWCDNCSHFSIDNYEYNKSNLIRELVDERIPTYKITIHFLFSEINII